MSNNSNHYEEHDMTMNTTTTDLHALNSLYAGLDTLVAQVAEALLVQPLDLSGWLNHWYLELRRQVPALATSDLQRGLTAYVTDEVICELTAQYGDDAVLKFVVEDHVELGAGLYVEAALEIEAVTGAVLDYDGDEEVSA